MANGAQALIKTLADAGIEVCFANPGTSEMHFVAALDSEPRLRAVLALFEGVATGAADGYARMAGKPAATLLHLGCGLGNGLANLHNARKGRVPVLNIVGDHATYHVQYDAQLQSDIETVARNVSPGFVRKMMQRIDRCYQRLDELSLDFRTDVDLGQIAAGCACGNTDFRYPEDDWRAIAPNLARWYEKFRKRPAMRATEPGETPFDSDDSHARASHVA